MRMHMRKGRNFSHVLKPVTERFVSAGYIVTLTTSQYENIEHIEFTPPKVGDNDFGRFKVTYKTPTFCEVNR